MKTRTLVAPRATVWRDDAPRSFRWEGESAPSVRSSETFTVLRHLLRPEGVRPPRRRVVRAKLPA